MNLIGNYYVKYSVRLEQINTSAKNTPEQLIAEAEETFSHSIEEISQRILRSHRKIVMLAGPSSSGKTTTASLLQQYFSRQGIRTELISLDDFFLAEKDLPLLPDGRRDYESPNALNLGQMTQCLTELAENNYSELPVFDFAADSPKKELRPVRLGEQDIVVVEGIHALNPLVTDRLPQEKIIKMYISVKQGILSEDGNEVLSAQDIRLIRRIIRDYYHRGRSIEETLDTWRDVCLGEKLYIQPFKRSADITANSLHFYEPCIFRKELELLLSQLSEKSLQNPQLLHLKQAISRFISLPEALVPEQSLLQEFLK